jgi:tRNA U34 5-methylaminomethyl-2-thiouridine-forming methyltransferase MnmC
VKREVIITGDGSHSIGVPELNVAYHSIHGAIQESMHVFINAGFYGSGQLQLPEPYKIFEVGFGTGLNALLTLIEAEKNKTQVYYEAVEPFPLSEEEVKTLNYCQQLDRPDLQPTFENLHNCEWEKEISISEYFTLKKFSTELISHLTTKQFNLVYFDAFAPNAQSELWTKEVFDKMYSILTPGGILVTYCSKGDVRRAMIAAGFTIEKLQGPPKKREMIRARSKPF